MEQRNKVKITKNMSAHRFEIYLNDELVYIEYHWKRGMLYLMHTVASKTQLHSGNADELIRLVLDHIKEEKIKAVVYCPLIEKFIKQHPEYADL